MNPAECDTAVTAAFLIYWILAIAQWDPSKIAILLWKQLDISRVSESSVFPPFFLEYFVESGRAQAQTQSLIDESVCLAAGILATSPLTYTHTHMHEHTFTNLGFSFSLSPNN